MGTEKKIYSTHSFMLPLNWDYLPKTFKKETGKYQFTFDERTSMAQMNDGLISSGWNRTFYRIQGEVDRYNEMAYFHSYANMSLFDMQQRSEPTVHDVDANKVICYYEKEPADNEIALYEIATPNKTFTLNLTGISLHVYNTGIAILSFNLENYTYHEQGDILFINDFGRRIYPQFLKEETTDLTYRTRQTFLPASIKITASFIQQGVPIIEDFKSYTNLDAKEVHLHTESGYQENEVIQLPKHITCLFNSQFVINAHDEGPEKIRLNILGDDRMFFQSWYGNESVSSEMKKEIKLYDNSWGYSYAHSNFWYAFVYGDKGWPSIANKLMMEKDLIVNTYVRWVEYGTLFGFTRDSFVSISTDLEILLKNGLDIKTHFKTMYYQMAVLCLAQRASILKFSAEVALLKDLGKKPTKKEVDVYLQIEKLYLNYIEFTNKLYLKEVSPQIQGIEVYNQFQKAMNIEKDSKNLEGQIAELHNFALMLNQAEQAKEAGQLTWMATFLLPVSIVCGFMGLSAFDKDTMLLDWHGRVINTQAWSWIGIAILLSTAGGLLLKYITKVKNK
jgi:hypothetical protein